MAVSALSVCGSAGLAAETYGDIGVNAKLAEMESNVRLAYAEFVDAADAGFEGMKMIFFKDTGNKQLGSHWLPGDPRGQGTTDVIYITDTLVGVANCGDGCAIDAAVTTDAIERGMAEWDAMGCASLPIVNA